MTGGVLEAKQTGLVLKTGRMDSDDGCKTPTRRIKGAKILVPLASSCNAITLALRKNAGERRDGECAK